MDWLVTFLIVTTILFTIFLVTICIGDADFVTLFYSYVGVKPVDTFSNKCVWVTGASSGIGEAMVKELAQCTSSKLILSARRRNELDRVKKECLKLNPNRDANSILVLEMDLLDHSCHAAAFKDVLSIFGNVDVLISNAGRSQRASWAETELAVDKELFELNVFSLINLNRIIVRHWLKVGQPGQLCIMSSVAGKMGVYHSGSYSGSKFALHGYFDSLRNETRNNGIDITIICPGPVFSPILKQAFTSQAGKVMNQNYDKDDRRLTAERCAHLTLIAIGNKLEECWMALPPIVLFIYLSAYQPFLFAKVSKFVHSKGLYLKARGTKER